MKLRDLFDQCATAYDQDRPKLVPSFDELYGAAMRVMPFTSEARLHVLDLGAGTGLFAAMVAEAFPVATLHLTDLSEAMLAQARQRFAGNPCVTYSLQEHSQLSVTSAYDLVISALSIHHLDDPDKRVLFQKVYQALRPGGMFINVDQASAPTRRGEEQYERIWLEDVQANGASELALRQARERMREDKNALLSDQLMWLSEAGFDGIDCWYKRFRFVVYGGIKMIEQGAISASNSAALHCCQ
jgi:tRNA (cmo5U34)-methyltransferase